MAEPPTSRMIQPRSGQETLPAHLEARYGIQVGRLTELDLGVYRVGRRDGPDWVARIFAADRPIAAAEGDAALLRRLEQEEYPAERGAAQEPVSVHDGQGVLVTRYVEGARADGSRRTFARLGGLLGRLHALPSDHVRDGGGWHHLIHQGSPAAEVAAARSRLEAAPPGLPADQRPLLAALLIRATLDHGYGHPAADGDTAPAPAVAGPAVLAHTGPDLAGPGPADPAHTSPNLAGPGPADPAHTSPDPAEPDTADTSGTRPGDAREAAPGNPPASRRPAAAPARQAGKPGRGHQAAAVLVADLRFSALLSHALVAFTIEFDNELERQLPHRTTWGPAARSGRGPWLVSLAMWANFLRFLPADGVPLRDVADLVPLINLAGLERWGYVKVGPDPADGRPAPPRRDAIVRPTRWGRRAHELCTPLTGVIEERWRERFGAPAVGQLTGALRTVVGPAGDEWPPFLPVSGAGRREPGRELPAVSPEHRVAGADLPTLLSRALMSFRAEFERDSVLSLPVSANVLRVLTAAGVALRDVPRRAGVAREAVSLSAGLLEREGYAMTGPDPAGGRGKHLRLTPRGEQAQDAYHRLADGIGDRWRARFGADVIDGLTGALRSLYAEADGAGPPLISAGLEPDPGGWRAHPPYQRLTGAMIADPAGTLPHYPMVSHRGGYPDGS